MDVHEPAIEIKDLPPGATVVRVEGGSAMPLDTWKALEIIRQRNNAESAEWDDYAQEFGETHDMRMTRDELLRNQSACIGASVRAANRIVTKKLKKLSHADKPRFRRMTRTR